VAVATRCQWEKFSSGYERSLSMLSERVLPSPVLHPADVNEEPAVDLVNKMGADYYVVSSDYPHSDGTFPDAMNEFFGMPLNPSSVVNPLG